MSPEDYEWLWICQIRTEKKILDKLLFSFAAHPNLWWITSAYWLIPYFQFLSRCRCVCRILFRILIVAENHAFVRISRDSSTADTNNKNNSITQRRSWHCCRWQQIHGKCIASIVVMRDKILNVVRHNVHRTEDERRRNLPRAESDERKVAAEANLWTAVAALEIRRNIQLFIDACVWLAETVKIDMSTDEGWTSMIKFEIIRSEYCADRGSRTAFILSHLIDSVYGTRTFSYPHQRFRCGFHSERSFTIPFWLLFSVNRENDKKYS